MGEQAALLRDEQRLALRGVLELEARDLPTRRSERRRLELEAADPIAVDRLQTGRLLTLQHGPQSRRRAAAARRAWIAVWALHLRAAVAGRPAAAHHRRPRLERPPLRPPEDTALESQKLT